MEKNCSKDCETAVGLSRSTHKVGKSLAQIGRIDVSNSQCQREQLIEQGQALVFSLAARIARSVPVRVDLEDLIGYGELGLAQAARDFVPDRGAEFTSYAYYRVRGAIFDGLAQMTTC